MTRPSIPKDPRPAVPSISDILHSLVDVLGLLLSVLGGDNRSFLPASILIVAALSLPFMLRRPESLLAWLVLALILFIHARDISRARARLRTTVQAPQVYVDGQAKGLSSSVRQFDLCAKSFVLASRGEFGPAEAIAAGIDRARLDAYARRVVDVTLAVCWLAKGSVDRASSCALVSIPIGNDEIDIRLAVGVLKHAWKSSERLAAISEKWNSEGNVLEVVALLARERSRVLRGASETELPTLPYEALSLLRRIAAQLGDDRIALRFREHKKRGEPYR